MTMQSSDAAILDISPDSEIISLKNSFAADFHIQTDSSSGSMPINEEDRDEFAQDLKVKVDNPQKHSEGLETFLTYRITASTTRTDFSEKGYVVRRRYNDFVWLRNKLTETYPSRVIPPLPCKHSTLENLDRYSRDFVKMRMVMLHRFLTRVIKHPILSYNEHLKIFLTANSTEFAHQKHGTGILAKMSNSIHSLSKFYTTCEKCPEFDDMKKYVTLFRKNIFSLENIMLKIYEERKDLTREMLQLSNEFEKWASLEVVISPILSTMANAVYINGRTNDEFLVKPSDTIFFGPVREYILYADSVKEALSRRDAIQLQYEISVEEVGKKTALKDTLTNSSRENKFSLWKSFDSKEKLEVLEAITPKLMSIADANQDKLEVANEDLRSDMERWNIDKKQDMKDILISLSNQYIQYYQKTLSIWEETYRKISEPLYS